MCLFGGVCDDVKYFSQILFGRVLFNYHWTLFMFNVAGQQIIKGNHHEGEKP